MDSPIQSLYVCKKNQRLVFDFTGGVLRDQLRAVELIAKFNADADVLAALNDIERDMEEKCERFLKNLDPAIAGNLFHNFKSLLIGTAEVQDLKPLYDSGVVTRVKSSMGLETVELVSIIATEVLFDALRPYAKKVSRDKKECSAAEWGFELQRFVINYFAVRIEKLPAKTLLGELTMPFKIRTYFQHYFHTVSATTKASMKSVVFVPVSENYAADAILVPKAANGDWDEIIIFEISVTDQR